MTNQDDWKDALRKIQVEWFECRCLGKEYTGLSVASFIESVVKSEKEKLLVEVYIGVLKEDCKPYGLTALGLAKVFAELKGKL